MSSQRKRRREENLTYKSREDLMEVLRSDAAASEKLVSIEALVERSTGDCLVLEVLVRDVGPHIRELVGSALEAAAGKRSEERERTFAGDLEVVVRLLDAVDGVVSSVGGADVGLGSVGGLVELVGGVLRATFSHCKESNTTNSTPFDSVAELLTVFRKAQAVHSKLLHALESSIVVDTSNSKDISLLKDVLDDLVDVGSLLSGMNVKSMADNWRTYTNLTQRHADVLAGVIDLKRPLEALADEILTNMKRALGTAQDADATTYILKVANFLVRVLSKLCFTFWRRAVADHSVALRRFLVELYGYTARPSRPLQPIADAVGPLVDRLSAEEHFCQESGGTDPSAYGGAALAGELFRRWVRDAPGPAADRYRLDAHLQSVIACLGEDCELVLDGGRVYAGLTFDVPVLIAAAGDAGFAAAEALLYGRLLDVNVAVSVFVQDVWLSVMGLSGPNYTYSVLCRLVDDCRAPIDSRLPSDGIAAAELSALLRSAFERRLDDDCRARFAVRYPVGANLALWGRVGVRHLPGGELRPLVVDAERRIERFVAAAPEEYGAEEFFAMVDLLNVVSTIPFAETTLDVAPLSSSLMLLWRFDFTNDHLPHSPYFDLLSEATLRLTTALAPNLNTTQLTEIADALTLTTLSNDVSAILAPGLLSTRTVPPASRSAAARNLLQKNSVVLKSAALNLLERRPPGEIKATRGALDAPTVAGAVRSRLRELRGSQSAPKDAVDALLCELRGTVDALKASLLGAEGEELTAERAAALRAAISDLRLCLG